MSEIPLQLYEKLMDGRQEWSRHGYLLVARSMVQIDEALDEYNEYRKSLEDFERVFNNE
jgi:hypothetical protein